jgi:hypothetical protein
MSISNANEKSVLVNFEYFISWKNSVGEQDHYLRKPSQSMLIIFHLTFYLARIFYADLEEEAAMADGARRVMKSDNGCMSTYCPRKSWSSTQHPSDFLVSLGDRYEISGQE